MEQKPVILFESFPPFSGSSLEVYNELERLHYNDKYDFVWAVFSDFNEKTKYKTVKFFGPGCNNIEKRNILNRTKLIIDSNMLINKPNNNVHRIHLRHGCGIKNCSRVYFANIGNVDAIIATSQELTDAEKKYWPAAVHNKFIITGLPSNDRLFTKIDLYSNGFIKELTNTDNKFDKIIGWLPTFRTHRFGGRPRSGKKFNYGLPILNTEKDFINLNDALKSINTLLMVQQHHGQMKDYKEPPKLSNIVYITEKIKTKYEITTHSLMSVFDALITDYSAAYNEFIILNRQIGLTIDDLVEYSKGEGFCYNYLDWYKGEYILDTNTLIKFINHVKNNNDLYKQDREQSLHKMHKFIDNKSTERVVNYILENNFI